MNYIKVSEAAKKWGISARRARLLCAEGKVEGAMQKGKLYFVPENTIKPLDGRRKKNNTIFASLLWLKDGGAIDDDDYDYITHIVKDKRNLYAHNLFEQLDKKFQKQILKY